MQDKPMQVQKYSPPSSVAHLLRHPVAELMDDNLPVSFDLRYARVAFPAASEKSWAQMQLRYTRVKSSKLHAAEVDGCLPLQNAIQTHLRIHRGIRCSSEQIFITNGTQESIFLSLHALISPGDTVVVEEPGYQAVVSAAKLCAAQITRVSVDDSGLQTQKLPKAGARLVFVTPSHQFPTGAVLSAVRRRGLYAWARACAGFIFEDDYDGEFRYDTRPLSTLKSLDVDERVIYAGSFSKTMHPMIRLGFMVLPQSLMRIVRELKLSIVGRCPAQMQLAMADFIDSGEYLRHLNRVRKIYAERRNQLIQSLETRFAGECVIRGSSAGAHILLGLRSDKSAQELIASLREKDLAISDVNIHENLSVADAKSDLIWLLISYGGIEVNRIDAAVSLL